MDPLGKDITNRPGRFYVSGVLLRRASEATSFIFSKINVVRAEHLLVNDVVEFVGLSMLFDEIPEASKIPFYQLTYNSVDKTLTAERLD